MTGKMLIILPFWEEDKEQVSRLAALLTDLTPEHTPAADLLFVSRFDASMPTMAMRYAARRFNIHQYRSKRREIGWPWGCNGTFIGAIDWLHAHVVKGAYPKFKGAFIAEGDSAPLQRNWLNLICAGWDRVSAERPIIAGPKVEINDTVHINGGGCFISTEKNDLIWLREKLNRSLPGGWDWILSDDFKKKGWAFVSGMRSHWHSPPFTKERWDAERAAGTWWVHGVKDDSLTDLARKYL